MRGNLSALCEKAPVKRHVQTCNHVCHRHHRQSFTRTPIPPHLDLTMSEAWRDVARARLITRPAHQTRDEYRQQLGGDVAALKNHLADAKELLNSETSLLALPGEIILHIMMIMRDSPPSPSKLGKLERSWADITVVCRRLRALSRAPTLWSKVEDGKLPLYFSRQILSRSGSAPLDVYFDGYVRERRDNLVPKKCASQHYARVRSLTLRSIHPNIEVWKLFMHRLADFPMLNHLSLESCTGARSCRDTPSDDPSAYAPPTTLKSLSMSSIPIPWTSRVYDNLVELRLADLTWHNAPSVSNLKYIFARSSRLAFFELSGSMTLRTFQSGEFAKTCRGQPSEHELNELRSLTPPKSLRRWAVNSNLFNISHYALPTSLSIIYEIRMRSELKQVARHLDVILPKHLGSGFNNTYTVQHVPPVVAMRILVTKNKRESRTVTISFYRKGDADAAPDVLLSGIMNSMESICDIFHTVDCSSVTAFYLDIEPGAYGVPWFDLLTLLPAIRALYLSEDTLPSFVDAFLEPSEEDDDPTPPLDFDTTLLYLDFLHVKPSEEYGFQNSDDTVQKLGYWLNQRKVCGLSPAELRVPKGLTTQLDGLGSSWRSCLSKAVV